MIRVTDRISIDESELVESFVRSSGPGGQNVNKLSTAVQLRFDVRGSPSLPPDVRLRLERLAGRDAVDDPFGELADRHGKSRARSQVRREIDGVRAVRHPLPQPTGRYSQSLIRRNPAWPAAGS